MPGGAGGKEVGRISIRVVPNLDKFHSELKRKLEELERTLRGEITVEAHLDTLRARGDMRTLMAKLHAEAADGVTIRAEVDRSLIDRFRQTMSRGFGGSGGMPRIGEGMAVFAAVLAFTAPLLALVSGVLITLPALLTALLVPIATVALGIDGLKNAAAVLVEPLAALKATLSARFEEQFTPIFDKLRAVFPTLQASMPRVVDGLADMARALTEKLTSPEVLARIDSTITSIGEALSAASPGIAAFTDGLTGLIAKVAEKLPGAADMFNQWGKSFSGWVDRITKEDWFGESALDRGLRSFRDAIQEVLDLVGDLANAGFDFLSDPEFGEKMRGFLEDIKDFVTTALPSLGDFFEDIAGFLKETRLLIESIPDWMKPNDQESNKPANPTANGIFPGWEGGKNPWEKFKDSSLVAWIEDLQNRINGVFSGIGTAASSAWTRVKTSALTAFTEIVTSAGAVGAQVVGAFSTVSTSLQTAWSAIPTIAAGVWNQVVSTVANVLATVVATVITKGSEVVTEVGTWPGKITTALGDTATLLFQAGVNIVQGLINGLGSMIGAAVAKAGELAAGVKNAVTSFLGINSPSKEFHTIGLQITEGLTNGINAGAKNALSAATKMAADVANAAYKETLTDGVRLAAEAVNITYKEPISTDEILSQARDMFGSLEGIAGSALGQLTSDLGFGGGALTQALQQGLGLTKQFVFNVASMDEALAGQKSLTARESLQYWRR